MLTVVSIKLPGVITSGAISPSVYVVKKEQSTEWETLLGNIGKFEYEKGYEYQVRISETSYLDYNMGDPAWAEYDLLEVISKVHKTSENLPPHFIPNWYSEECCPYIDPEFDYVIQADEKEDIEKDLKTDAKYKFEGLHCYIINDN